MEGLHHKWKAFNRAASALARRTIDSAIICHYETWGSHAE